MVSICGCLVPRCRNAFWEYMNANLRCEMPTRSGGMVFRLNLTTGCDETAAQSMTNITNDKHAVAVVQSHHATITDKHVNSDSRYDLLSTWHTTASTSSQLRNGPQNSLMEPLACKKYDTSTAHNSSVAQQQCLPQWVVQNIS